MMLRIHRGWSTPAYNIVNDTINHIYGKSTIKRIQQQHKAQHRPLTTTTTNSNRRPTTTDYRPRVVILGSGWAGNTLARELDKNKYDVRVVSPANHFLFTPLLPGTAVGTLEFRAIQEPIRTIEGLGEYYQAKARKIDIPSRTIRCEDLFKKRQFSIPYDYLILATGNKTNTFSTPGVASHEGSEVFFLKHLYHARQIRNRVLECFERASADAISPFERKRLLSFVVVGGGPTSCEFTSEMYEFLTADVSRWYPDLIEDVQLTLVEAGGGLLGSFDKTLAEFYLKKLRQKNIDVRLNTAVTGVFDRYMDDDEADANNIETTNKTPANNDDDDDNSNHRDGMTHYTVATFADGTELPFGTMVWSAGLAPVKFIENSELPLSRGKVVVDEYLRVPDAKGRIFALGDCATPREGPPLPPTATVAEQQALYVGNCFNSYHSSFDPRSNEELPLPGPVYPALFPWQSVEFLNRVFTTASPRFVYKNRGNMASMGSFSGVAESRLPMFPKTPMTGISANLTWKAAYWTKQLSWSNMILIPMYWFKQFVFGRDISRF